MIKNTVKVIMYDVEISGSVFESLHGMGGRTIREFYIPSEKLIFNTDTGTLNVFEADWPREDTVGEYDIPKEMVDMVVSYFRQRQAVYALCRDYQSKYHSSPTTVKDDPEITTDKDYDVFKEYENKELSGC